MKKIYIITLLFCVAGAVRAQQDTVWGMTQSDGVNGYGGLFSMQPDGSNLQAAYSFTSGDGFASGSLTRLNGIIYGMTTKEIFSYNPTTSVFVPLYTISSSTGNGPSGKLTLDPANGQFYGVMSYGGANSNGVIFSFDPATNTYTDLYDFNTPTGDYPQGPLTLYNQVFYGLASDGANSGGVIFSFDPATNTYTDLYDATNLNPGSGDALMTVIGNKLYGVGMSGGANGQGILFSFDPAADVFNDLYDFNGSGTPALTTPMGIMAYGSTIYGVTQGNYFSNDRYGTLFSFNTATQALTAVFPFTGSTGAGPAGNLAFYNGNLLGMTASGGANNDGTIFSYKLSTKVCTDLFDLSNSNSPVGDYPPVCQLLVVHNVGTTPQTITFSDMTKNYGDAPFDPGAVTNSGLPVIYSSDNPLVVVINGGNQVKIIGAGTANISAFQDGNATYDSITVTHMLTVNAVPLQIMPADTFRNQEQPDPVFRVIYSGFVNGDSAGSLTTLPAITSSAAVSSPQGTYTLTASGAVDPNYIISYAPGALTVIGLFQTLSYSDTAIVYGVADTAAGASSSGLPVTYTSSDTSVAVVTSAGQVHIRSVGATTITVSQAGSPAYAANSATFVVHVTPAPLTIAADNKTKVYDQPDPVFSASYAGFVNGDDANSLVTKPVFVTTAPPGASPGAYLINVGGAADSNYTISYVSGTFVLTPVQGGQVNSVTAWFSSPSSLQLGIWMMAGQTALLQVYDVVGHRLIGQQVELGQGYNLFTLPAAGWVSGIYIVRLSGEGLKMTQTIQKIN